MVLPRLAQQGNRFNSQNLPAIPVDPIQSEVQTSMSFGDNEHSIRRDQNLVHEDYYTIGEAQQQTGIGRSAYLHIRESQADSCCLAARNTTPLGILTQCHLRPWLRAP
jgi:hypothetical protein